MRRLSLLLPTKDNVTRRLILSEVLGQPVSMKMRRTYRHEAMHRGSAESHSQTDRDHVDCQTGNAPRLPKKES